MDTLRGLGIPDEICRSYTRKGLKHLYDWQKECLTCSGVFSGNNLVYCAPTGGGKTLVAELVILKTAIKLRKQSILVLPYISLVHEKERDFRRILHMHNKSLPKSDRIKVRGYHSDTKSYSLKSYRENIIICTIERANMIVNALIVRGCANQFGCMVIDELHVLGDEQRGYHLEILISKLKHLSNKFRANTQKLTTPNDSTMATFQLVALSATIPNLQSLARWFGATLFTTSHRPVPLQEMVVAAGKVLDTNGKVIRILQSAGTDKLNLSDQECVVELCSEGLRRGQQIIVFCSSRNMCEVSVRLLVEKLTQINPLNISGSLDAVPVGVVHEGSTHSLETLRLERLACVGRLEDTYGEGGLALPVSQETLLAGLRQGIAFHHAGLSELERLEVETMFRKGLISILVATSTLAAGVNLPAGRVVIRSMQIGRDTLGPIQYKQMCGRAGRPGLVAYGECFLVVRSGEVAAAVALCHAPLPVIRSQIRPALDGGKALLRAILEMFALGLCDNESDVITYVRETMAYQECVYDADNCLLNDPTLVETLLTDTRSLVTFLNTANALEASVTHGEDMSSTQPSIKITRFGRAVVESGLNPDEVIALYEDLMRARELGINLETNLHLLYLITPLSHTLIPDFRKLWGVFETAKKRKGDPFFATFECIGIEEGKLFRWTHQPPKRDDIASCADRLKLFKIAMQLDRSQYKPTIARGLTESDCICLCRCKRLWAASALNMLVECQSATMVGSSYGVPTADILLLQRSAMFLSSRLIRFCREIGWLSVEKLLQHASSCIAVEEKPSADLAQIMCIPKMNSKLARLLYDGGYTSVSQLASANVGVLTQKLLLSRQFELQDTSGSSKASESDRHGGDAAYARASSLASDLIIASKGHLDTMSAKADEDTEFHDKISKDDTGDNQAGENHGVLDDVDGASDWGVLDDESNMSSEGSDASSSDEEEEGMMGYKHQAVPWRPVNKEISLAPVIVHFPPSTTSSETAYGSVRTTTTTTTIDLVTASRSFVSTKSEDRFSQVSLAKKDKLPMEHSYYAAISQCSQTQVEVSNSMYASNQAVATVALSSTAQPGPSQPQPPTIDIPDEAFLALFDQLEQERKLSAPSTAPLELPPPSSVSTSEGARSPHRIESAQDGLISSPPPHQYTAQSLSDRISFESPYLRPYTPSKRSTPGQFLYLPQTHCSPGTPSAAAVIGKEQISEASRKAFVWKHVAADRNCSEFLKVLKKAKCVAFDLLFAAVPVSEGMSSASVVKAWAPFIAHSPSSSVPSGIASTHSSKADAQVLVGVSMCFGSECGFYLPLPVPPPLLDTSVPTVDNSLLHAGQRRPQSLNVSLCGLNRQAKMLISRFVGFNGIINKCPMLRCCLAGVDYAPPVHLVESNPLMCASKEWAACCRTALRVEWTKGNCVEWRLVSEIMSSPRITKIALDMKLKMICLRERDVFVNGHIEDPNIALTLLEVTTPLTLPMPNVQTASCGSKRFLANVAKSCYASIASFRVMGEVESRLHKQGLWATFANIEMPLIQTVVDAEFYGFPIETTFFSNLRQDINDRIKIIEYYFRTIKGPSFNLASPQDVAALRTHLQRTMTQSRLKSTLWSGVSATALTLQPQPHKSNAASLWSTGKENIASAAESGSEGDSAMDTHPLMQLVKEWRSHTRLIPTLSSVLSSRYRPWGHKLDRVRACFNTIGTETGRLIVTSPPLQQVPHECRYIPPARPTIHEEIMQARAISKQTAENVIEAANRKAAAGHMEWVRLTQMKSRQSNQNVSVSMDTSTFSENGMYQGNGMTVANTFQCVNGKLVRVLNSCIADPISCGDRGEVLNLLALWREAGFPYSDHEAASIRIVEVIIARKMYFYPADKVCRLLAPVVPDSAESNCVVSSYSASHRNESEKCEFPSSALPMTINPRNGFKATKGNVFLTSDYSQIELRILAHFSMDPKLLAAFAQPYDIFSSIASQWTGKAVSEVMKDERDRVKQLCYALLYGAGPAKVAADAGCSVQQAELLMANFMGCYPGIQKFMNQVKSGCRARGYVETLLGRRRHLKDITSSSRKDRARAERQAVNTMCQGSAADLIKLAMINIQHQLEMQFSGRGYRSRRSFPGGGLYSRLDSVKLVLQVHDELVFEVPEEYLPEVAAIVKDCMENALMLRVPLAVKMAVGETWGALEAYHGISSSYSDSDMATVTENDVDLRLSRQIFDNSQLDISL